MAHYLTTIRAAAVTALTGLPTTGTNVGTVDAYPIERNRLPALIVRTGSTPEIRGTDLPPTMRVDTRITVDTLASANAGAADLLDQIAAEVQAALCSVTTIGGRRVMVVPVDIPEPEFSGDSDQVVARRSLVFLVTPLFVAAHQPETLL